MMKAGRYYVGDLCYVMHDAWVEVCALLFDENYKRTGIENNGELTLADGRKFAIYNTSYGDGRYPDNIGNEYSVDAGVIGCIHVDDINMNVKENDVKCGVIHEFSTSFETGYLDGIIRFGDIDIYTDEYPYEYDEEEYEDCDE